LALSLSVRLAKVGSIPHKAMMYKANQQTLHREAVDQLKKKRSSTINSRYCVMQRVLQGNPRVNFGDTMLWWDSVFGSSKSRIDNLRYSSC